MSTCCTPCYTCHSAPASSAFLRSCFPHPKAHYAFFLTPCFYSISSLVVLRSGWHEPILHLFLQPAFSLLFLTSLYPILPHSLPHTTLQPWVAPYVCQQLQSWCAVLMSNCQPSFLPLPPPLSGPSRLGYALITLSILPSCQLPCSRVVTAQGHHGSTVELWVS